MIGFPNPLLVVLLLLALLMIPITAVILVIWNASQARIGKRRQAVTSSLSILGFSVATMLGWTHFSPPQRQITLAAQLVAKTSFPFKSSCTRSVEFGHGVSRQDFIGVVNTSMTLPDGKRIEGTSGSVSVVDSPNGVASVSLFIEPLVERSAFVKYWLENGTIVDRDDGGEDWTILRTGYTARIHLSNKPPFQLTVTFPEHTQAQEVIDAFYRNGSDVKAGSK